MKYAFNRHTLALLTLAASGLPLMAQAAESATITIKAVVAATYTVSAPTTTTINTKTGGDIVIKINTNATKTRLILDAGTNHDGNKLLLKKGTDTMKLDATLDNAALVLTNNKMSKDIDVTPNTDKNVTLHVTPQADSDKLPSGEYSGSVTVKVEAA